VSVCVLREYDHLITKKKPEESDKIEDIAERNSMHDTQSIADPVLKTLQKDTVVQLERRGYYRVDCIHWKDRQTMVLIKIPDGKTKAMSTLSTKIDAAKLTKGV